MIHVFNPTHWQGLCHESLNQPRKKGSSCVQDNNLCFTFSSVIPRNAWQRCGLHHKTRNALWGIKQSDGRAEPQHLQSSLQKPCESSTGEKAPLPRDANIYVICKYMWTPVWMHVHMWNTAEWDWRRKITQMSWVTDGEAWWLNRT